MAGYTFTITDAEDGHVHVSAVITGREGGNRSPAGLVAQATMVFLTELQQKLQEGHLPEPPKTLQ